ncbi:MAG: class A beta-lactamase-related serine hydrolase [Candidatus Dadabacteria bacterium]|nr:MAG: class A beta-lactamase-related serine hydrolase [Candidatus Dadabacteria bacterium]
MLDPRVARYLEPPGLVRRAPVPEDLDEVTSIDREAEVNPREVGSDPQAVEAVWRAVIRLYRSGIHPAIQLCVRRCGKILLNRAIGYARGGGPQDPPDAPKVRATVRTPFNIFSASKAITAMVIHLLDQRRLIHLDDPVCEYLPEFATSGKQWITIRHVLTHRAGIPNVPEEAIDLELLDHPEDIIDILSGVELLWRPGRQVAYHAISGGFILGEIVRRVTGSDIRQVLREEIQRPLGMRWLNYGVAPEDVERVALNYFTGPLVLPPVSTLLRRVLGIDFYRAIELSNDPRFLTAIVPAANVVATAEEHSRFYQLLLNGGELDGVRIFDRRTVRRATSEQSYLEFDLTLGVPLRYGMGFMLGGKWLSLYGTDTVYAFGHLGFTNVLGWADPERQVAAALMTSGKPVFYPELVYAFDILRRIKVACPKVPGVEWPLRPAERRPSPSELALGEGI